MSTSQVADPGPAPRPRVDSAGPGSKGGQQTSIITNDEPRQQATEEQALEVHEVIELQTFSERRAWIEEKIKFLEALTPIGVFEGLEALRTSSLDVPGLPTREQLQQWIVEHDAIEKETEIFDKGELKKLRQLTKAATQRNLSPQDTDVIELTLTTIYALDKLLHLLRDRSENLDMLSVRLTWEEQRQAAWKEREQIIDSLRTFMATRARWNPSIYEQTKADEPSARSSTPELTRRNSVASLASAASDLSVSSPAFSTGARFKLAEVLSRDAAQFTGRVTALRHGKVAGAGKALDKLIDNSRKPVPDELLDEQDRVEEKCITELEQIGKFTMGLVMQWRKADEIYVETMKDSAAISTLLEEIEIAKLHHPTARQSASFNSRIDIILKRLAARGDPVLPTSLFPSPTHPLFPDQRASNVALAQQLSAEISNTVVMARKVEALAKEYRSSYDAVKRMETLLRSVAESSEGLEAIIDKFHNGIPSGDDDGSPPDLSSERSLDPTSHSVFLALHPSLCKETETSIRAIDELLKGAPLALFDLDQPGIEATFKETATAEIQRLRNLRTKVLGIRDERTQQVIRLREARRIHANIHACHGVVSDIRKEIADCMQSERWKQETTGTDTPPTPQTPTPLMGLDNTHTDFHSQLAQLANRVRTEVRGPLLALDTILEAPLRARLKNDLASVDSMMEHSQQMLKCLLALRNQTGAMRGVKEDLDKMLLRIEDCKMQIEDAIEDASHDKPLDHLPSDSELGRNIDSIRGDIDSFAAQMTSRIPFIAADYAPKHLLRPSSLDQKVKSPSQQSFSSLPFDPVSHDAAVRADGNSFVMRVRGRFDNLLQTKAHLDVARQAREIDEALRPALDDTFNLKRDLETQKERFSNVVRKRPEAAELFQKALEDVMRLRKQGANITRSLSPVRGNLRRMEERSRTLDTGIRSNLYGLRNQGLDDAEEKLKQFDVDCASFQETLRQAAHEEVEHQKKLEQENQERLRKEEQRRREEEAARAKAEQERLAKEAKERDRQERLAKEKADEIERRRLAAERAEKERAKQVAAEAEKLRRLEAEREAEANRRREEEERRAREASEKARQQREKAEVLEKLRSTEAELEQERRLHAQTERKSADLASRRAEELKELEKRQREIERLMEERSREATPKASGKRFAPPQEETDVFGSQSPPPLLASKTSPKNKQVDLRTRIFGLRKRLRSICIQEALHPPDSSSNLPTEEAVLGMNASFKAVSGDIEKLPDSSDDSALATDLTSLRSEVEENRRMLDELSKLASLSSAVLQCDNGLSDLLEHIDSYPAIPLGVLSSPHKSNPAAEPEEQMMARLTFTKNLVDNMKVRFAPVASDKRAISETDRIVQTWGELEEMTNEKMVKQKSRPPSTTTSRPSSGRNSSVSINPPQNTSTRASRKKSSYSNLSVSSVTVPSKGGMLAPPPRHQTPQGTRRTVSGASIETPSRSASRMSTSSNTRSVSGPFNSSIYGSTFASRQRTTSLSGKEGLAPPLPSRSPMPRVRSRLLSDTKRSKSPLSDSSNASFAGISNSRSSGPTFARAPRDSFSSILPPRVTTPVRKAAPPVRKKYIADPQNKLDVAVGDVVNQLPVGINIEGVTESWRDQSGKYWIGNQDPKLCFCRILRSQTVMVRVGGGWQELSKFIKDHFADSFRVGPDSPGRLASKEEKWISSATLLEEVHEADSTASRPEAGPSTHIEPPKTPEPSAPFVPSFSLMTPSAQSPRSLRSSPSTKGSPLTPLQFIRRADVTNADSTSSTRPATPSKPPARPRQSMGVTPVRASVWRP